MSNPYAPPRTQVEDAAVQAGYFAVSRRKLVLMSFVTLNIYVLYWFYQNWKAMQAAGENLNAPVRAIFYPFTAYYLFRHVRDRGEALGIAAGSFPAGVLAFALLVLSGAGRLPEPWWLITFLGVLTLLPVQTLINEINARVAPEADRNERFTGWNIFGLIAGGLFFAFVVVASFLPE